MSDEGEERSPHTDEVDVAEPAEEEQREEPSLEMLIDLVKQGWHLWVDRKKNRIRLRDPETRKTISIPFDEEIYKRLKAAKDEAKAASPKRAASPYVTSDLSLWNTFIGRHRPLIESLITRISWLQDAVLDIGMNTLIFVLMATNEQPEKLPDVIATIKDRDKFVDYIMYRLINIYLASRGADEIARLRERVAELEAEIALLEEALERYRAKYEEMRVIAGDLKTKLDIALSIMNDRELRKMLKVITISSIKSYRPPSEGEGGSGGGG